MIERVGIGTRVRKVFVEVCEGLSIPHWTIDEEAEQPDPPGATPTPEPARSRSLQALDARNGVEAAIEAQDSIDTVAAHDGHVKRVTR